MNTEDRVYDVKVNGKYVGHIEVNLKETPDVVENRARALASGRFEEEKVKCVSIDQAEEFVEIMT